jgi:hypothetical protein
MFSQSRSHFLRQIIGFRQHWQGFSGRNDFLTCLPFADFMGAS